MSSFQQLRSSRDKRHAPSARLSRDVAPPKSSAASDTAAVPAASVDDRSAPLVRGTATAGPSPRGASAGPQDRHNGFEGVEVRTQEGRGRGLFATQAFTAGELSVFQAFNHAPLMSTRVLHTRHSSVAGGTFGRQSLASMFRLSAFHSRDRDTDKQAGKHYAMFVVPHGLLLLSG